MSEEEWKPLEENQQRRRRSYWLWKKKFLRVQFNVRRRLKKKLLNRQVFLFFFFVVFLRRRVQLCEFCNYNKVQLVNKRLEHINRCYFTCQSEILFLLSLTKLSFRYNNYRWVRSNPHFKKSNKVNVMHWRVLINNKINGIPFLLFVNCFERIYFKKKE